MARLGLGTMVGVVLLWGASIGRAEAAPPSHPPRPDLEHTGFTVPCGVATDTAGNYYVADAGTPKTITVFSPQGSQLTQFTTSAASCKLDVDSSGNVYALSSSRQIVARYKPTGAGFPPTAGTTYELDASLNGNGTLVSTNVISGLGSVAVDPATQNVYVTSKAGNEIQEYATPTENYKLTCEGDETAATLTPASTTAEIKAALEAAPVECKTVTVAAGSSATRTKVTFSGTLANKDIPAMEVIKAGGNVSAWQVSNGSAAGHVTSFQPNGTPISNTIGAGVAGAEYIGVDVYGKTGKIYVTDKPHGKAIVFNNAGTTVLAEFDGSDSLAGAFNFTNLTKSLPDVAVDQSNGHAYVSDMQAHNVVDEFDGAGAFVSQLAHTPPFEEETSGNGIAVDNSATSPNKGTIFLTARTAENNEPNKVKGVFAFGPLIYAFPLKVTKTGQGAGTVTSAPAGIACGATCLGEFEADGLVTLKAAPGIGSALGEWSGCDDVNVDGECEVEMSGVREVSVRFDSRPVVSEEAATQITSSSATLKAQVNPKGKATDYYFEYISEAAWLANGESFEGSEPSVQLPASPIEIGGGTAVIPVAIAIEGLASSTTYHFRAVAENEIGTAEGERDSADEEIERSFTTFAAPDSGIGKGCSNASLRTGPGASLPDCRAYEQASPVDKNGGSIQALAPATRTGVDGSTITFESTTGVPGGTGAQNFPTYLAKRGPGGWTTTGLLPTPSSGQRAAVLGWSADFAIVFDRAELFGQGIAMLARSTAAGTEAEITPHTSPNPEYGYVDTSVDGATTIFEARPESAANTTQQLTPDAAPGRPNVYAWEHGAEELRLAGVLPDGSTPPAGSRVGGGIGAEEYNRDAGAVLEDGSAFFNTNDAEGQLYLRLNPTAGETTDVDGEGNCIPDPDLACTVYISKTQKDNGKGQGGRDAAGQSFARLAAASADGNVVTFASAEKLTNDANTGPEPDAPAIARAKASDGGEKQLGFVPTAAHEIAVDDTEGYVYWSDPEHGRIGRAKLDGTDFTPAFKEVGGEPLGIAVVDQPAAKYVFWTDRGPLDDKGQVQTGMGSIGRADLEGAGVNPSCYSGLSNPRSIAADASHVYWTMPGLDAISQNLKRGDLGRAELGCNAASLELTLGETFASGDVAVDTSHVYLSLATSDSFIIQCSLAGVGCQTVANVGETGMAPGIALDATHLYWSDREHNRIGRANLDGSSPEPEFIPGAGRPEDLARGGEHVLWTAFQGAQPNPGTDLYQFDRNAGVLTDLAPDSTNANGTEVQGVLGASEDGSYVYFAANGVPDNLANASNEAGESAEVGDCIGVELAAKGTCNLYLAHGGQVEFIARLDAKAPGGEKDSGDAVNWVSGRAGVEELTSGKMARVSADGRVLVFRSSRALTDYDNAGPRCVPGSGEDGRGPGRCLEFYRFDHAGSGLTCLTCSPRGAVAEGPAGLASVGPPTVAAPRPAATLSRNLSRDGSRFFFESPDALSPADTNGQKGCPAWGSGLQQLVVRACQDVYEWEAAGTGSCKEDSPAYSSLNQGCIYLISTGKSKEASFFADADPQGNNVFIHTYEQLVPQDEDALMDAYDVRVGGGLASQHVVRAEPCGEGNCAPEPSAPPAVQSPGSAGYAGPPDPEPQRTKPKKHHKRKHAKHRRKGKGNKARHGKGKQKQRAAKQNGRAGR